MAKKIIIIAVIAVVVAVGVWLVFPRSDKWEKTLRCYGSTQAYDSEKSDDTSLKELSDYVDVECSFEVTYSFVIKPSITGTVNIGGEEFKLNSQTATSGNGWIPAVVSSEDQTFIYLSSDRKNFMLFDNGISKDNSFWVAAEDNFGNLKKAAESFGFIPMPQ